MKLWEIILTIIVLTGAAYALWLFVRGWKTNENETEEIEKQITADNTKIKADKTNQIQ